MSKPQRKISTHRTSRGCVQHVICMVGMPARGKTYIGTKLARYTTTMDISGPGFPGSAGSRPPTNTYPLSI